VKWFKVWSEARHHVKLLKLAPIDRWHWLVLLCVANDEEPRGSLPPHADLALELRVSQGKAASVVTRFRESGLLDYEEALGRHVVHDWDHWQKGTEDLSAAAVLGNHLRWHVARGRKVAACDLCAAGVSDASGRIAGDVGGESPGESGAMSPAMSGAMSGANRNQDQSEGRGERGESDQRQPLPPPPPSREKDLRRLAASDSSPAATEQGIESIWDEWLEPVLGSWKALSVVSRRTILKETAGVSEALFEHVCNEALTVTTPETPGLIVEMVRQHRDQGCGVDSAGALEDYARAWQRSNPQYAKVPD
jgi:hypothetical protein